MNQPHPAHSDKGLLKLLTKSWVYRLQKRLVGYRISRTRLADEFIKVQPGDRIFDIGCGPGDILEFIPGHYGRYVGFDMNPDYVAAARRKWGENDKTRFYCETVAAFELPEPGSYDTALAIGLLHHLDDDQARHMLRLAHDALRPGGRLITHDCVYVDGQHPIARWLIDRDRGKAVRTTDGYRALARDVFGRAEASVRHDMFRMPYTVLVMDCVK